MTEKNGGEREREGEEEREESWRKQLKYAIYILHRNEYTRTPPSFCPDISMSKIGNNFHA